MGTAADVMRRKISAFNAQDATQCLALCSPDVEWAAPGALLRGPDQAVALDSALWEAFPDIELTVTRVVEEGSVVIIQGRAHGSHQGTLRTPGGDIPATGRRVELTFFEEYEVQGEVIVSERLLFDRLELLEQLGVVPAPASA